MIAFTESLASWRRERKTARRAPAISALIVVALIASACSSGGNPTASVEAATAGALATATQAPNLAGNDTAAPQTPAVSPSGADGGGSAQPSTASVPAFKHVWVMVLENASFGVQVDGSSDPYFHDLIGKFGLAANYFAVSHPSQPNYLALFSGSTQGVADDSPHDISAQNLADQLEAHGKTWRVFEQDFPGGCFAGSSASGQGEGFGVAGSYARKHNPAISFDDIRTDSARCKNIQNLASFDPAAADFALIVPNGCNDMHSCPLATADAFLSAFVPKILNSTAFADSVLFITTDEGTGRNQVATLAISPLVKPGFTSNVLHDHYSLLRTIEDAWGLGCLGNACSANNMAEFFAK